MRLRDDAEAMCCGDVGASGKWALLGSGLCSNGSTLEPIVVPRTGRLYGKVISRRLASLGAPSAALVEPPAALEPRAALPSVTQRVYIPKITDPPGTNFAAASQPKQHDWIAALVRRVPPASEALLGLMTNTCNNYPTITSLMHGAHGGFGSISVTKYFKPMAGAWSYFKGRSSTPSAGRTSFTPHGSYHMDECRRASSPGEATSTPGKLHEWGALGGVVHRPAGDDWHAPLARDLARVPDSDAPQHAPASIASLASVAISHIGDMTPDGMEAFEGSSRRRREKVAGKLDVAALLRHHATGGDAMDIVVFPEPRLSLLQMLRASRVKGAPLTITSPQVKPAAGREVDVTARIETTDALVLADMGFYQSDAREPAKVNGCKDLVTNPVKLTDILVGYGYTSTLPVKEPCVDAACSPNLEWSPLRPRRR